MLSLDSPSSDSSFSLAAAAAAAAERGGLDRCRMVLQLGSPVLSIATLSVDVAVAGGGAATGAAVGDDEAKGAEGSSSCNSRSRVYAS